MAEVDEALVQPVDTVTLNVTADTSVRQLNPNKNFGSQNVIDANRSLVMVDTAAIKGATTFGDFVVSAKLRLTLVPSLLPRLPCNLSAHRVSKSWTESGATWNCAVDSNTSNLSADCSGATKWSMTTANDAFVSTATGTASIPTLGNGVVEIDVTEDVRAFDRDPRVTNYGWILKSSVDLGIDVTDFYSHEGATPPQLVLSVRKCNLEVCDDGLTCSQDGFCSDQGFCMHLTAGPFSPCNADNNACTLNDHCSGMGFDCVPGTPAPVGTACGSGLECNDQQECVPSAP